MIHKAKVLLVMGTL